VKKAQVKYGKKPLTGEQVRWGLENLSIDDALIKKLGFSGFMMPVSTSCVNHAGEAQAGSTPGTARNGWCSPA